MGRGRRWQGRPGWAAAAALFLALPLSAQTNGSQAPAHDGGNGAAAAATADSVADLLARADSARAALVQPPGSYGGVRAMDLVRVPFQLFGATLALGYYGLGAAYLAADEVLIEPAIQLRDELRKLDVDARVDAFGNRSWPGVVLRYEGLAPFYAEAGYTLRQYEHYEAGVELDAGMRGAHLLGRFGRFRQPHFWGIGPDSREEDRSDFQQDLGTVEAGGWWTPAATPLTLSGSVAWERSRTDGHGWDSSEPNTDEVFSPDQLFGLDERTDFLRVGAEALLDGTYVSGLQVRGYSLLGAWSLYEGVSGTDAGFHRVAADARGFLPVNWRQLLAVRLLAEEHLGESGQGVPFTHLARLGDDQGLRGFSGRRFRDRALLAAQLEWRYQVFWHPGWKGFTVEGFAFADVGAVGPSLGDISRSDFRATPGIGLRYVDEGEGRAEAFVARGGGEWRVAFGLGRTF